jgi:hypothetical protein
MQKVTFDKKSILTILIVLLTCTASFGLGRISAIQEARAKDNVEILVPKLNELGVDESKFQFVGSKNGTKYYPLSCKSANRIKDENKVYFNSTQEAIDGGYTLASGC